MRLPTPADFLPGNPLHGQPPLPRFMLPVDEIAEPAPAPTLPPIPRLPEQTTERAPAPTVADQVEREIQKPGCLAADRTLLAYMHLACLSRGWGGFGVLRQTAPLIGDAMGAARFLGEHQFADELEAILQDMARVKDIDGARRLVDRLEPVVRQAWDLGVRCGKTLGAMHKALATLDAIKAGQLKVRE